MEIQEPAPAYAFRITLSQLRTKVALAVRWRSCNPTPDHFAKRPFPVPLETPTAFLDRDGVLNVDHGYVHEVGQLDWIEGAPEAVRLLNEAGFRVVVITNQSGVARGHYDEDAVSSFHAHMQTFLQERGARIDAFYVCPHHPEGIVPAYAVECECRKPKTGLLEQAARDWPVDLRRSFVIGDRDGDIQAAAAFGIDGVKFDWTKQNIVQIVQDIIRRG
jgi:D-glycero-D-manno-heptose 1,7-bisphosphate phosphatase